VNKETDAQHVAAERIGRQLGFETCREASISTKGAISMPQSYQPRLDVLWSQRLTDEQRTALKEAGDPPLRLHEGALPIAAWEIEGSDVSTKGMQADLANIRTSGARFGFLAAKGGTKDNLFKRAVSLLGAQEFYAGTGRAIPLDARWLEKLALATFDSEHHTLTPKKSRGSGGEGDRANAIRTHLRKLGEGAGFVVQEDYGSGITKTERGPLTASRIDQVWLLPLPKGFATLLEQIQARDKALGPLVALVLAQTTSIPVVAFEIENDAGKHGFGCLLNLASHAMSGLFVPGNPATAAAAEAALRTYAQHYPLSSVSATRTLMSAQA